MSPVNYLNKVVELHIGKAVRYALCIKELPKNRILCFAVTQKQKDGETAYKIFLPNGEYSASWLGTHCSAKMDSSKKNSGMLVGHMDWCLLLKERK